MKQTMIHKYFKNTKDKKDLLDYLLYFFVFATPLFEIPQAIKIYSNKSAHDISIITWGFFLISNIVWLIWGIRRKLLPVILTYSLYMLVELAIVIGIIIYSK